MTTLASFGLRRSPVFVGQTVRYENVVHYVAPDWPDVAPMLEGLRIFVERTKGAPPTARAAVASFAFVYIHPLADGNGRVHRFLVNDVLRRDGAVHALFILPISALITEHSVERARYDEALKAFSRPLMGRYADRYSFTREPEEQPDCRTSVSTHTQMLGRLGGFSTLPATSNTRPVCSSARSRRRCMRRPLSSATSAKRARQ